MNNEQIGLARQYHQQRESRRQTQREAERQHWLQRTREAILRLVPVHPEVRQVYLFGSLIQPGRFRPDSDIDVAIACDTIETESIFWRELEQELKRDVDLRPLAGVIAEEATTRGEKVYER